MSVFRSLFKLFSLNHTKEIKISSEKNKAILSLNPEIEPYKLFDCVMLESRYSEIQDLVRENGNPDFDAFYDLGIVIGSSPKLNNLGVPRYYIIGWYNPKSPDNPLLKRIEHNSLIPVIRPLGELNDRSEHLNRMFHAFFTNWLDLYNHEHASKN